MKFGFWKAKSKLRLKWAGYKMLFRNKTDTKTDLIYFYVKTFSKDEDQKLC